MAGALDTTTPAVGWCPALLLISEHSMLLGVKVTHKHVLCEVLVGGIVHVEKCRHSDVHSGAVLEPPKLNKERLLGHDCSNSVL
jgi:hypothetical protein